MWGFLKFSSLNDASWVMALAMGLGMALSIWDHSRKRSKYSPEDEFSSDDDANPSQEPSSEIESEQVVIDKIG
jgi:hypothetical protein